jgi:CarD family transcriptional regulator
MRQNKETLMQFKVDDFVVHPIHGVGHIVEIEQKRFSDEKETRLYYKLMWAKRVVWIPVETQAATGLRLVTAKGDLEQYRNLLKSRPTPLPQKHYQRHLELVGRLKQSSFQVVCEVVRDLTAWSWRKPLGSADTTILQRARESLSREWATAAGVSTLEAIKEIDALLGTSRQAFMGVI